MKQDLQNLRDEIKQLGREIRAQLKGELLGPQLFLSVPALNLINLGSMWPREASDISRPHSRPESLSSGTQSMVISIALGCFLSSFIYNETTYSYSSCLLMYTLWEDRWGLCYEVSSYFWEPTDVMQRKINFLLL
jgi:hypothetical protein